MSTLLIFSRTEPHPELLFYSDQFTIPSQNNNIHSHHTQYKQSVSKQTSPSYTQQPLQHKKSEDSNTFQNDFKPDNFYNSSDTEFTNSLGHIKNLSFKESNNDSEINEECLKF